MELVQLYISLRIKRNILFGILILPLLMITSCEQQENFTLQEVATTTEAPYVKGKSLHPYGGWYCPDNLTGFPPVNVADLAQVPVVNGRMPTKEETRNGTSLMYFDPTEYPTAKPLKMTMPRLARYYSRNTKQEELVIVIQAVYADEDTVVGFRYLNGGNGTSWLHEVDFLSSKEVDALGSTPFVFLEAEIDASKEKVWSSLTNTAYAKMLGKHFNEEEFFTSEWSLNSEVDLSFEGLQEQSNGHVMLLFGNIYLQIDYNFSGQQSVEKILIMNGEDDTKSKFQLVFGPFEKDFEKQEAILQDWLNDVKTASEEL